jgi:hypothetical protein
MVLDALEVDLMAHLTEPVIFDVHDRLQGTLWVSDHIAGVTAEDMTSLCCASYFYASIVPVGPVWIGAPRRHLQGFQSCVGRCLFLVKVVAFGAEPFVFDGKRICQVRGIKAVGMGT